MTHTGSVPEVRAENQLPPRVTVLIVIRDQGLFVLWALLVVIFAIAARPHFLTTATGISILNTAAISSIFAAGLGIGVMTGVLDLSVPGTAAVAAVAMGMIIRDGGPVWIGLVVGVLVGVAVGLINGWITVRGFDPLIATIGMLSVLSGLALVLSGGLDIAGLSSLDFLGTNRYLGIPGPVYVSIAVFALLTVMLKFTRAGMRLLAVGGNGEAARRVGIKVNNYRVLGFVISGVCAAIGGIVNASYIAIASPTASTSVIFQALTAVALAGVPFTGGRGSLPKVFVGGVVLATINAGLLIMGVQTYWATIATGVLLIGALVVDRSTNTSISKLLVTGRAGAGKDQA